MAFRSGLDNFEGEVDPERDEGIWLGTPGSLQLVVREGDPAPDTPAGVAFASFISPGVLLNSAGEVAVLASLRGTGVDLNNDRGIWVGPPGDLQLVARAGDQAPGLEAGTLFDSFELPSFNSNGGVTFKARLKGAGVSQGADEVVYGGQPGELVVVAREGWVIDFSPGGTGDFRQVSELSLVTGSGGQDGKPTALNDAVAALVAINVEFEGDITGIFVSPGGELPDGGLPPERPTADDFDADGTSDILWRNSASGSALFWEIQDFMKIGTNSPGGADPAAWQIRATGDFDGDDDADILWRNTSTGQALIWEIQDFAKVSSPIPGQEALAWEIRETGDFDKDGDDDVLWRNTSTGQAQIWEIEDLARIGTDIIGGADPVVWQIKGAGDFDEDGDDDIVWRNTSSGSASFWEIEDLARIRVSTPGGAALEWKIREAGDFDRDGDDDVLWRNTTTGSALVWQIEDLAKIGSVTIGGAALDWEIRGAGDHDGMQDADILWRNASSGSALIWEIENIAKVSSNSVGGADPAVWDIQ